MSSGSIASAPVLEEEDRARADWYALLAQLYYRGPDAGVLALIAKAEAGVSAETASSPFSVAWRDLSAASSKADPAAVKQEYDDLFVGTGRAEVSLYVTCYLAKTGREKILVALRAELAVKGLSRMETAGEPEDHVAGLFDVMRHLIERGSGDGALQDQRDFFGRFLDPAYVAFCDAIAASAQAEFYRRVAAFTRAFLNVEAEVMKMT